MTASAGVQRPHDDTTVLVTGGFGFIGSHLVQRLLAEDRTRVVVIDDLSSSPLPLLDLLAELRGHSDLEHLDGDVTEVSSNWQGRRIDEIYHLASFVGPAGILPYGGQIAVGVVNAAAAVADLADRTGAKMVFVSSSEVYGGGRGGICAEDAPRLVAAGASVRREYAAAKIASELLVANRAPLGLDVRIVRPFNVAGPRQSGRGGFVLPRFIGQALRGEDLTVCGDGSQIRAFTAVEEIASGLVLVMKRGTSAEIYNLGNINNRTSILDLATMVLDVVGGDSGISFLDPRSIFGDRYEEAADKVPDASRAVDVLGWVPTRTCRQIVESTTEYMRGLTPELRDRLGARAELGAVE